MNTFSTLKTSIARWLGQDDLTTYIPDFLEIAQVRVNRLLRIRAMEDTASLSTVAGQDYVALPTDFIGMRGVYIDGTHQYRLQYLTPEQLNNQNHDSGRPRFFTIRGDNMVFAGNADAVYSVKLSYYKKLSLLSNTNTSNWFTTNFPHLYLYGSLQAAAEFIQDDAQVQKWSALFQNAIREIEESDQREKYGPAPVIMTEGARW